MLSTPILLSSDQRRKRSLTQDIKPFLNILIQYTNLLLCDSYLFYFQYKTLEETTSQTPFQTIFIPVQGKNTGTFYRTIHPQNITLSIQDVFVSYMNKLIERNEKVEPPLYLPSHLESLKEKHEDFEVPDLETRIQRHGNPHYWLQQAVIQIKQYQYRFFQNIILNEDTIPQIEIFSQFLLKFLKYNYQLL